MSAQNILITTPNLTHVDDVYEKLINAHEGLSEAESLRLNAKLILTLFNHIGNEKVIYEALNIAKMNIAKID